AREAQSGQFVNVHRDGGQPFLRRPFGILAPHHETGHVTIIYRLVGKGTEEMKGLRRGDALSVEGPLGEGVFTTTPGQVLLAGGGVGLAPLIFLAKRLDHPIVLVAGKTAAETFWIKFFEPYAGQIYVTTDDGSLGIKGFAVDALPQIFAEHAIDRVSVCGPTVMMKTIAQASAKAGVACEVSMEKRMACGIGVCLGCTFESQLDGKRYKVCADGPVFDAKEVFA
uniref:dihydroorotate dehydrogenase electron transfer subunit n=1 Tax=Megasphaera sp. TaxID=2023260 RepID=UPI004024F7EE